MNKKNFKLISCILAFAYCFPLHFLYAKYPIFITSIFSPVNESIWEHTKILFGSIILAGISQKIYTIIKKQKINNICFSTFIAAITSISLFLILFLSINYFIKINKIITIIIMFISIALAESISYIILKQENFKLENKTIFMVIFTYIIFAILTYYPLKNNLFIEEKNTYEINNPVKIKR